MNTIDKELYEIETQLFNASVAIDAMFCQNEVLKGVGETNPELALHLHHAFMGTEVPSGEALGLVKKAAKGVYNVIKAIIAKTIELIQRVVEFVVGLFSKKKAEEMAFKRLRKKAEAQMKSAVDKVKKETGIDPIGELKENLKKSFSELADQERKQLEEMDRKLKDAKVKTTKEIGDALDSLVVDKNGKVLDPNEITSRPMVDIISEENIALPSEKENRKPSKKDTKKIKVPKEITDFQDLIYDPNAHNKWGLENTEAVNDKLGIIMRYADFIIDTSSDLTQTLKWDVSFEDMKVEAFRLGNLVSEKTKQVASELSIDLSKPHGVITSIPGKNAAIYGRASRQMLGSDVLTFFVERGDERPSWKEDSLKRPRFIFDGSVDDLEKTTKENEEPAIKLKEQFENLTSAYKESSELYDKGNIIGPYEDFDDKYKSTVSEEEHSKKEGLAKDWTMISREAMRTAIYAITRNSALIKKENECLSACIKMIMKNK